MKSKRLHYHVATPQRLSAHCASCHASCLSKRRHATSKCSLFCCLGHALRQVLHTLSCKQAWHAMPAHVCIQASAFTQAVLAAGLSLRQVHAPLQCNAITVMVLTWCWRRTAMIITTELWVGKIHAHLKCNTVTAMALTWCWGRNALIMVSAI